MGKNINDYGQVIYKNIAGSTSYGTNTEESDLDIRGIYIPHRKYLIGIDKGKVDTFQDKEIDDIEFFSIHKFVSLAIEGNPSVVQQLFVKDEHVIFQNEYGKELREMRREFLTKNVYGKFGSYAFSQMKRLNSKNNGNHHETHRHLIEKYGYDTKHAAVLIMLFQMGTQILSEGDLDTFRPNKEELLSIRNGMYSLEDIKQYAEELNEQLEEAMLHSTIPDYPDYDKINKWLVETVDKAHGITTTNGVFKGITFNVLPLEYEMIDKCSILSVSNRLVRKKSKSQSMGIVIPYKDWFIGLRKFNDPFKFEETSIDSLHTIVKRTISCDPKVIDMLFASKNHVLYEHPMAKELKMILPSFITTKNLYHKTCNYVAGNIKKMKNWEQLKEKWNKNKSEQDLTEYPPVPKKTNPNNAAMMNKFGYDTLTAFDLVHVLKLSIELMKNGKIVDSRVYEPELYAIKNCKYKTFDEFNNYINELLVKLEEVKEKSVLPSEYNLNVINNWLIDFIDRFHSQLD